MEYIQGNSIATMLSRQEGFSIWDLIDISRQVCAAMEHAATRDVVHSSLEPDKILVQWDGLVKVLGYGISNMSLIEAEAGNGLGRLMPYCSPEQIRGEPMDHRSNQFTLGAILFEMVTGRKAFDADDPVELVGQIENETPVEPVKLNPKIQPSVSAVIMRALAKDPAERYATAREFLVDLELCKETGKKADATPQKPGVGVKFDTQTRRAVAKKFVSAPSSDDQPVAPRKLAAAAFSSSRFISATSEATQARNSGTRLIEPKDIPQADAPADIEKTGALILTGASIEKRKPQPPKAATPKASTVTADPMMMEAAEVRRARVSPRSTNFLLLTLPRLRPHRLETPRKRVNMVFNNASQVWATRPKSRKSRNFTRARWQKRRSGNRNRSAAPGSVLNFGCDCRDPGAGSGTFSARAFGR